MNDVLQVCSILEAEPSDGWIQIMPLGKVMGADGRGPYFVKDPAAIVANSKRPNVDLAIDRDHEAEYVAPGQRWKAAGWMKDFQVREDGIYAAVQWTESAKQEMAAKEYRYVSPAFRVIKATGEITRITGASLVNRPNFELKAVASMSPNQTENETEKDLPMDKSLLALAAYLALPKDATVETIATAAQAKLEAFAATETELASIRTGLKLDEKADAKVIQKLERRVKSQDRKLLKSEGAFQAAKKED